ncbi:MAG: DUF4124 domain-containing protein [Candidatus Methylumidiphilus sp.]
MRGIPKILAVRLVLPLAMAVCCGAVAAAGPVYKCVQGGKVTFTQDPGIDCQPVEIHAPEPNPVDVARQKEANRRYALERVKQREEAEKLEEEKKREAAKKEADARRKAELQTLKEAKKMERQVTPRDETLLPPY